MALNSSDYGAINNLKARICNTVLFLSEEATECGAAIPTEYNGEYVLDLTGEDGPVSITVTVKIKIDTVAPF